MGSVIILEIPSAFAGPDPDRGRDFLRIVRLQGSYQHPRDRFPALPLLRARYPPPVGAEPVRWSSIDRAAHRMIIDAEVVPIYQVDKVVQRQPPGRVGCLMEGAGSQSALTLEDEYPHPFGARPLESQRDACRGRAPMTRRSGIELEKKGSSLHLSVPGQPA